MKQHRYMTFGFATGALLCASAGHAGEASGSGDLAALEEVVVTAERREESVQDTPLAIAVVDPEELSWRGVKDFTNIDKLLPDVTVDRVVGSFRIAIRGIQSGATSPTTETPNAVHIDGAYIDRPSALDGMFFDVRRIEVLKGPQGTLYGRNTPSGAVNIITNDPVQKFEASGTVEAGSYSLVRAEGMLNVPVGERFAWRLAARHYKHDGYFKSGFDDANQQSVRLKGQWTIADDSRLLLSLDYQKVDQSATPGFAIFGYTPGTTGTNIPVAADPLDDSALFGPVASRYFHKVDNKGLMAQYDKSLSFANLTIQASHRLLEMNTTTPSVRARGVAGSPPALPAATVLDPGLFNNFVDSSWTTLESRLASKGGTTLDWVLGLYVFDSSTNWFANQFQTAASFPAGPQAFSLSGPFHEARSYATFGQATWTPVERLHLTAGLRYNSDEKEAFTTQAFGGPVNRYPAVGNDSAKWTKTTGTVRIAYDVTPQNMLYASYSTGYQAGGFGYGSTPKFNPEEVTAYEIGSKNRFLDDRLQLNAELYQYDDKDRPLTVLRVLNPGAANQTLDLSLVNAGVWDYKGGSLDLQWAATASDRVGLGLAYSNAKYVRFVQPAPIITILDGQPQNGPKWTGKFDYGHQFRLSQGSLDLNLSGQYRGKALLINVTAGCASSPTNQSICNSALPNNGNIPSRVPTRVYEDSYWLADMSLNYTSASERWSLSGYVNNVFDTVGAISKQIASPSPNFLPHVGAITSANTMPITLPRTFGVTATVRF